MAFVAVAAGEGEATATEVVAEASVAEAVGIPVIASGGAGTLEHLYEAFTAGKADAALAASIFHFGTYTIKEAKDYLRKKGVAIRD